MNAIETRRDKAIAVVASAAEAALQYFRDVESLHIEQKGVQDLVSNADRNVEMIIREQLLAAFADDGIVGEEHEDIASRSGYTWIIDPIDGTANFVRGMPGWCVVLACVSEDESVIGVVQDPVAEETFVAVKGQGASRNGIALRVSASQSLDDGSTGVGYSIRTDPRHTLDALQGLMDAGGVFYRNGSGALMLCYVAAARLIGYCEPHMNSWDCVAGLLMISEAGGEVYPYAMSEMLNSGACIVAGGPGIYPKLYTLCKEAYQL